jgi:glutamine amidotransferase
LSQSQHATEAKLAVNGDGFGIAWYGEGARPGLYRDVLPAWADDNLTSLCRMVHSRMFLAHVRASTVGETARANCHPFSYENWSFCHNGQVPHITQLRRALEATLPDALYHHRKGSTDSELLFLLALANGLDQDPAAALRKTLAQLGRDTPLGPVRLTCVLSDGNALYALRYASDARAPTLYLSGILDNGGRAFASEPLDGNSDEWEMLPVNTLVRLQGLSASTTPLRIGEAA